ncbi:MAG TPA: hypothetical protein PLF30_03825 [Candidatus Moranbacteria bacterium]|jgi:hypothetical protein|nr:hypothetical protein [Candidatus Moranbacteria bacterium]HOF42634.1 hypothetical protein [Candidatus Moranbacteria bacterium]HPX94656.1 hypothetical protein [Candidatus Moranbacteria bacterium]HQB59863.1 hypothetical protein [Candidatus Moranbacteria bacterium]
MKNNEAAQEQHYEENYGIQNLKNQNHFIFVLRRRFHLCLYYTTAWQVEAMKKIILILDKFMKISERHQNFYYPGK